MYPGKLKDLIPSYICLTSALLACLLDNTTASPDEFLQVAMHDRCNEDDISCGLPKECCCKPTHNFDFRKLSLENVPIRNRTRLPVHVLCVNVTELPPKLPIETESFKLLSSEMRELTSGIFSTTGNSSLLRNLTEIYVWKNSHLTMIRNFAFSGLENLRTIILEDLIALSVIERHSFWNLPSLREMRLKRTGLMSIPLFTGLSSSSLIPLKIIFEDTKITQVHSGAFSLLPERIKIVQLTWNMQLTTINDYAFNGSSIAQLILNNNKQLTTLQPRAFYGLTKMTKLSLSGTSISSLPTDDLKNLIEIDVRHAPLLHRFPAAQELLPSLRVAALTYTYHCCALNAYGFGRIFIEDNYKPRSNLTPCDDSLSLNPAHEEDISKYEPVIHNDGYDSYIPGEFYDTDYDNYTMPPNVHPNVDDAKIISFYDEEEDHEAYDGHETTLQRFYKQNFEGSFQDDYEQSTAPVPIETYQGWWRPDRHEVPTDATRTVDAVELCYIDANGNKIRDVYHIPVKCTPRPDAFNPCENVLGTTVLPVISWTVSALAIIGNFFVILVLSVVTCDRGCARQHHLSVQKFLVLNLAVADMCMGIYLLMVSAMDARSSGEYFKYGVEWQTGIGCRIAGFLSIFSSQLSVYTLSVISLERWYAIHFAIHLDKRMTMRCARICILIGWLMAGLLATLPLIGVNNYEKTSICLPFDVSSSSGMAYVGFLLFIAIGAFFVDVICYLWMYTTVRTVSITDGTRDSVFNRRKRRSSVSSAKSGAYQGTTATADATVAKRMAVLVFTNFACFFPISFFALTAAAGSPLISISQSKILLVVFYPLNSCCNPFLYAILTKSFRSDLLAWFKSRGYCIPLAAKLQVAQWRRNSADPGSVEKRETCVRKRLQQCVKYVSKKKSVHIDIVGDDNASANSRGIDKDLKPGPNASLAKLNKNKVLIKARSNFSKKDLDNTSNSFTSYHSSTNHPPTYKGMSRIFKLALMTNRSDDTIPTQAINYSRGTKQRNGPNVFFPQIKWLKTQRKATAPTYPNSSKQILPCHPESDDSSPLVGISDSRHGGEFSVQINDGKHSSYTYERRCSKSRHSTTTIETRLTVSGNNRGDHDNILQDVGASTP